MSLYLYEAVDSSGRKIRESASYTDESTLKSSLREKGLTPLSIKTSESKEISFLGRVTSKDLLALATVAAVVLLVSGYGRTAEGSAYLYGLKLKLPGRRN
jgi:type II secretory pathway component PulF